MSMPFIKTSISASETTGRSYFFSFG